MLQASQELQLCPTAELRDMCWAGSGTSWGPARQTEVPQSCEIAGFCRQPRPAVHQRQVSERQARQVLQAAYNRLRIIIPANFDGKVLQGS